jgi:hypothetical protein
MLTIIAFIGLVLNLVGTLIVSLSAGTVMVCIHSALMAHQTTLEAYLGGERNVPVFTGLDETRKRELDKSAAKLKVGLRLIVAGFLLQAVALVPQLISLVTKP